jgi:hypothetical protein
VETKEPYSQGGGQLGLDFRGRGRKCSCKNMQLQDPCKGKVIFQRERPARLGRRAHHLECFLPHRNNELIKTRIHRDGNKYTMHLQSNQIDHPIFCAKKRRLSSLFTIGDMGNMDAAGASPITESLFQTKWKGLAICYSLYQDYFSSSSKEVALIKDKIPLVMSVFTEELNRKPKLLF